MKTLHRLAAAAVLVAAAATSAHANNLLTNGDFEANGGSLDGWFYTTAGNAQVGVLTAKDYFPCCQTSGSEPAYSQNHFAEFDDGNVTGVAILVQPFTTVAGRLYTLSFRLGAFGSGVNTVDVGTTEFFDSIDVHANDDADTTFSTHSYSFVGSGGLDLVAFAVNGGERDNTDAILDDVKVSGGVPEPSIWALMICGFGGAGAMLRRWRTTFA